jgi:hypothetical protein
MDYYYLIYIFDILSKDNRDLIQPKSAWVELGGIKLINGNPRPAKSPRLYHRIGRGQIVEHRGS